MEMRLDVCARLIKCAALRSKVANRTSRPWLHAVKLAVVIAVSVVAYGSSWQSTAATYAWEEGYKQVIPSSNIESLSPEGMFGEQIGLYTGSLSFLTMDVELRGNNSLRVAYGRYYSFDNPKVRRGWRDAIPRMEGVYPKGMGWLRKNQFTGEPTPRCSSGKAAPPNVTGGLAGSMGGASAWDPTEYWNGDFLNIPGQGSDEILKVTSTGARLPQDGRTYMWLTRSGWRFSCLTTAQNDPGEGFLAVAPDGTRYYFDWFAAENEGEIQRPEGAGPAPKKPSKNGEVTPTVAANKVAYLHRDRVYIYPTRVEDRFGNYVTYTYEAANPMRVLQIAASDGSTITVSYAGGKTVTAAGKTWTYSSDNSRVTLPDGSYWDYDFSRLSSLIDYHSDGGTLPLSQQQCDNPPAPFHAELSPYFGTVRHPSGAVATFTVAPTRHGRSYVDRNCISGWVADGQWYAYAYRPYLFDNVALTTRQISGPGLSTLTWRYEYGPTNHSWTGSCTSGCATTKYVDVIAPDNVKTRHIFSNHWGVAEGKELAVETFDADGVLRRKVEYTYLTNPAGQPYPAAIGQEGYIRGDQAATKFDPLLITKITQDGRTFTNQVNAYDEFARPTNVIKTGAPAP